MTSPTADSHSSISKRGPHAGETIEALAADIRSKHNLSSLNLWNEPIEGLPWIARAFRREPRGFEASSETGGGLTIRAALISLDERLTAGPINKTHIPILDADQREKA